MTETPDAEQLDQIDERIDKARARAEEAGILVEEHEEHEEPEEHEEHEEEFVDSGEDPEDDDQTIAP